MTTLSIAVVGMSNLNYIRLLKKFFFLKLGWAHSNWTKKNIK